MNFKTKGVHTCLSEGLWVPFSCIYLMIVKNNIFPPSYFPSHFYVMQNVFRNLNQFKALIEASKEDYRNVNVLKIISHLLGLLLTSFFSPLVIFFLPLFSSFHKYLLSSYHMNSILLSAEARYIHV